MMAARTAAIKRKTAIRPLQRKTAAILAAVRLRRTPPYQGAVACRLDIKPAGIPGASPTARIVTRVDDMPVNE
jgi:hypothetical protein